MLELEDRRLLSGGGFTRTFTVTSTADTAPAGNPTYGTLRWAVEQADGPQPGIMPTTLDVIHFDLGGGQHTITLEQGPLELSRANYAFEIDGPGASLLSISGNGASQVFQIDKGVSGTLSGLTITGGDNQKGGGIDNGGSVTLNDCTISGSSATDGGGIDNSGTVTLNGCTLSGNSAIDGGGIYNSGTATLNGCTFSGNSAQEDGGGIHSFGPYPNGASASTDPPGTLLMTNCTVAGNSAKFDGGGVFIEGGIGNIQSCTVYGNSGDGIDNVATVSEITDTIVAGDTGGDVLGNTDDGVCNLIGGNPLLAPLGDYGGPTPTMPLLPGSPAIGRGTIEGGVPTDERGQPLDSPTPDIGAYQVQPAGTLVVSSTADGGAPLGEFELRGAVDLADIQPGAKDPITFDPTVFASTQTITLMEGPLVLSNTGGIQSITDTSGSVNISGEGRSGVFQIDDNVRASLSGLDISGGRDSKGGGIDNDGVVTLADCTISGNIATDGGGIWNQGTVNVIDCTISGNSARNGGGIYNKGPATVVDGTISGNFASSVGGGIDNQHNATLTDTIVAGNTAGGHAEPSDIGGPEADTIGGSYDLIGTGGSGGIAGGQDGNIVLTSLADLGLAPLGDYGGPTPTMPLLPGSAAIGTGTVADDPGTTTRITTDQRGLPLDSPAPDIGAFQFNPLVVNTTIDGSGSPAGDFSLRQAVNLANVLNVAATISFAETTFATAQTITLEHGQLELSNTSEPITIEGPGSGLLSISANQASRVFEVDDNVTATLSGLDITKGEAFGENGGGVLNHGTLYLNGCIVSHSGTYGHGDRSDLLGGGIANFDKLSLTDCTISGNYSRWIDGGAVYYMYGGAAAIYNAGTGTATLTDCTVTGNKGNLGAIYNKGTATLTGCTISQNASYYSPGAGFFNDGTATLTDCTVTGNSPSGRGNGGGAIFDHRGQLLTMVDSTVSDNNNGGRVGGILVYGEATIIDCTISGNSGMDATGIGVFYGTATIIGCTISGNSSALCGGILVKGSTATIVGSTISGNSGPKAGLYAFHDSTVALTDTIVAGDNSTGSVTGDIFTDGTAKITASDNLIGEGGTAGIADGSDGNIVLTSPSDLLLAPLGNYGGPTQTMALLPGSAAIGAGVEATDPATGEPITTDQRGAPRPTSGVDIGAFQDQGYTLSVVSGTPQSASAGESFAHPLVVVLTEDFADDPLPGATIGFEAPAAGASAVLGASSKVTNSAGQAIVKATANGIVGTYLVTASAAASAPVSFALTNNLAQPVFSVKNQTITYGTDPITISGGISAGKQVPSGDVAVTLDGVTQDAVIATNDKFSTTFTFTTPLDAAGSPYTVSYAFTAEGYFLGAQGTSDLTVNPALLTVTANNQTMNQGGTVPALTYTYTGQVAGGQSPTFTGVLATKATTSSPTGNYLIKQGTLAATGDYKISKFLAGTLTIKPASSTATGTNGSLIRVGAVPGLNYTNAGVVDGDQGTRFSGCLAPTVTSSRVAGNDAITRGTPVATGIDTFVPETLTVEAPPTRGAAAGAPTGSLTDAAIDGLMGEADFAESLGTIPADGSQPRSSGWLC